MSEVECLLRERLDQWHCGFVVCDALSQIDWMSRRAAKLLDGLVDETRPGRPVLRGGNPVLTRKLHQAVSMQALQATERIALRRVASPDEMAHVGSRDAEIYGDVDALIAEVISHGQELEPASVGQAVADKIHARPGGLVIGRPATSTWPLAFSF